MSSELEPVTPIVAEARPIERTLAEQVWDHCREDAARVATAHRARPWSTRDILIAATESFAEHWATTWDFSLYDPNDVKELARWQREFLRAAGAVPEDVR